MKDPMIALAGEQLIDVAIDVHVQLEQRTAIRPVLWLLARAKRRAAEAMAALVDVDVTQTSEIMFLQSKVSIYKMLMEDVQELMIRAPEEDLQIAESERLEIADALDIEEALALGLKQTPEDM